MNVTDAQLTGAKTPVTLTDGKTYLMRPLEDVDVIELDEWVKQKVMSTALKSVAGLGQAVQDQVIAVALRTTAPMTWLSGEGARMMGTLDGVTMMLWQSLSPEERIKSDPVEFRALVMKPENAKKIVVAFKRLNSFIVKAEPEVKKGPQDGTAQESTSS